MTADDVVVLVTSGSMSSRRESARPRAVLSEAATKLL